ncbi:hypothetical protein ACQRXC_03760 [Niallia taxi]|uniref:hypothetical protein n=1 Tax=Niallia taxi TaxID=2499688 RepID=UPI003F60F123
MANVKIELELDWMNEDDSLDETLRNEVVRNLQNRLIANVENKVTAKLNTELEKIAERVTENFITKTLEAKIEDIKIPYTTSHWDSKVEYIPISQFIGKKYEEHLTKKSLNEYGEKAEYNAKLSISEYFIKNYLAKELTGKVSSMIQTARKEAEETIVKALENNLKEQLSVDIINRLNIPKMLESLQSKALEFEKEE